MDCSNIELLTERLRLKSLSLEYLEDAFREFTPEITHFMFPKSPDNIDETRGFIEESMRNNKNGEEWVIVILDKSTGEFLGCGGVGHLDTRTPELGVWLKKSVHGNGYGLEAMRGLKQWIDENVSYDWIVYPVAENNYASKRIPVAMGGKVFQEYDKETLSGKMWHFLEYRIYPSKE